MSTQNNKPGEGKPEKTLGDSVQEIYGAFKRAEISLPQAIILAAIIIALGIFLS